MRSEHLARGRPWAEASWSLHLYSPRTTLGAGAMIGPILQTRSLRLGEVAITCARTARSTEGACAPVHAFSAPGRAPPTSLRMRTPAPPHPRHTHLASRGSGSSRGPRGRWHCARRAPTRTPAPPARSARPRSPCPRSRTGTWGRASTHSAAAPPPPPRPPGPTQRAAFPPSDTRPPTHPLTRSWHTPPCAHGWLWHSSRSSWQLAPP